jgi:flotillin
VQLTVTGVAQVKVMTRSEELLHNALVQFLGRSVKEVEDVILQTLEGHLRAILGSLTVEAIYQDRESFAAQVTEVCAFVRHYSFQLRPFFS